MRGKHPVGGADPQPEDAAGLLLVGQLQPHAAAERCVRRRHRPLLRQARVGGGICFDNRILAKVSHNYKARAQNLVNEVCNFCISSTSRQALSGCSLG